MGSHGGNIKATKTKGNLSLSHPISNPLDTYIIELVQFIFFFSFRDSNQVNYDSRKECV